MENGECCKLSRMKSEQRTGVFLSNKRWLSRKDGKGGKAGCAVIQTTKGIGGDKRQKCGEDLTREVRTGWSEKAKK